MSKTSTQVWENKNVFMALIFEALYLKRNQNFLGIYKACLEPCKMVLATRFSKALLFHTYILEAMELYLAGMLKTSIFPQ